jgi:Zn-dependent protease
MNDDSVPPETAPSTGLPFPSPLVPLSASPAIDSPDSDAASLPTQPPPLPTQHLGVMAYQSAPASAVAAPPPATIAYPEVLAEMELLQNKKSSWTSGIAILAVSLLLFIGAGIGDDSGQSRETRSWNMLAILVPILFIHELGHFLAMRIFHYRNLRMFFIPFFGAAVTGQNYTAPGWKKVIVSLMGPLPGIILGTALGIAGILMHNALFIKIALTALLLNGINLLPLLPLDGGRVMQALYFSRHYAMDVAFRAIAGAALLAASAWKGGRVVLFLGILMLLSIPLALRTGRIAGRLKREGFVPPTSESQSIPPELAQVIITRIKTDFPKNVAANNKIVAQNAMTVYETLCNRPPGVGATIGFTLLHGGAFVVALGVAVVLLLAQTGRLNGFGRPAIAQPKHAISASDVVIVRGSSDATPTSAPLTTLLANFTTTNAAKEAFDAIRPRLGPAESLERFGQTLLLSFPRADDAARKRWLADLEARTPDVTVEHGELGSIHLVLTCVAPDQAAAARIEEEAREYFRVPRPLNLLPPWSPNDARTPEQRLANHIARSTYGRVISAGFNAHKDPRMQVIDRQINVAMRHDDKDELQTLRDQMQKLHNEIRQSDIQKLRDAPDGTIDPVIIDTYLSLPARQPWNDEEDANDYTLPAYQMMARRMGQAGLPMPVAASTATTRPTPPLDPYAVNFGSVKSTGGTVQFQYVSFANPIEGASALINWLAGKGCTSMKYEFKTPGAALFDSEK